ncbi:MAG: zinc-ribbon domain-containing protein [Syntrophales bacterium]|nr:zinc-ribbon domain-containing protein [Syntrophales bacterium]
MVIECAKCKTKYRFDETQVEENIGFWVRCTRCGEVFFQLRDGIPNFQRETIHHEEEGGLQGDLSDIENEAERKRKKRKMFWLGISASILITFLAMGTALFMFSTEVENLMRGILQPTAFLFEPRTSPKESSGPSQIRIVDLQQRFVSNVWMGNVRVIEGMARNEGTTSLTKIKVKAELFDAGGVRVMEGFAYCGNLLTDKELGTLTAEEINRKLSNPAGSDFPSTSVAPRSAIPFMIVIFGEPQGVTTAYVSAIEAERLLQ